jgi:predicted RNase H-like HicB family nuclease
LTLEYRSKVFEQDGQYVAVCPELNVSSFDETPESAEASLEEAVAAFLEGCEMLGTLGEVLQESGFTKMDGTWRLRERLGSERVVVLP